MSATISTDESAQAVIDHQRFTADRTLRAENEIFTYCLVDADNLNRTFVNIRNETSIENNREKIDSPERDERELDHIHTVKVVNGEARECSCKDYEHRCKKFNLSLMKRVSRGELSVSMAKEMLKLCKHGKAVQNGDLDRHA